MSMTRQLRCELSEDQLSAKAQALASSVEARKAMKAEKKRTNAHFNSEIKKLDERIDQLTRDYTDRSETRSVPCDQVFDERLGEVRIVRQDTNATIDSRPMTAEERMAYADEPVEPDFGDEE